MAITPLTVTIDLNPSYKKIPAVYVSQLDNNLRELAITVKDGGVNYDVASSGYDVYVEGTKPDKHGFSYKVTDIGGTVVGSVVTVPMQTQMTCVKGMVSTEIVLKSGSDRIGSANFLLVVERAGLDEDTDVSETDIPGYIDGAQRAAEAAEDAKDLAVAAKDTAVSVAASIPADYTTLSNDVDDLKSATSQLETYINPYYADVTPMGNDYFFKSGMFSVSGGTATIDEVDPLTVTNVSSGVIRSVRIPVDATQTNICLDVVEKSRASMGGSLAFFNAGGAYISQTNFTMSNGRAFITTAIPSNTKEFIVFLNPYAATTYTFSTINVYYGTAQILEKSFFDVLNSNIGLLGKKWGAVGDSLTATTTLGVSVNNYVNYVADSLGLNAVNLGVAGTGYMNDAGASKAFWQRYNDIPTDTDVLTVFGSLNDLDLAYNNIGTLKDTGTETLYGCMNTFLQGVYLRNIGMRIGIILPTPWQWMNRRYPNEAPTMKTEQYINALIAFCQFNSLPMLNLFDESGMHPWDADFKTAYYKNGDGTHPNSEGHYRFIYPKVKAFVSELLAK